MKTKIIVIFIGLLFAAIPGFIAGVLTGFIFRDWMIGAATFVFIFGLGCDVLFNSREYKHIERTYKRDIK